MYYQACNSRRFGVLPRILPVILSALPLSTGAFTGLALSAYPACAADESKAIEAATRSQVASVALPKGTYRVTGKEQVAKVADVLQTLAKAKKGHIGTVEVLLWQGNDAPRKALLVALKEAGYHYDPQPAIKMEIGQATLFTVDHREKKSNLLGLWIEKKEALLLAWGSLTNGNAEGANATDATPSNTPTDADEKADHKPAKKNTATTAEPITLQLDARASTVNVMGKTMPPLPDFPKLAKKPGVVRGYVYDTNGNPVKGAKLGVRSTAAGGFYSGAQGKTDAKGYYEIQPPAGAAHFYCAGATIDYGDGIAALGLHPEDGDNDGFATPEGVVRNFILLPYGIADRAAIQDNPQYGNNYYGGSIVLGWSAGDDSPKALPANAEIELTLTPDGPLVDGSPSRVITIRKKIGEISFGQLYVNNIPAASYHIRAKLVGGGALHMTETGPYRSKPFGLDPKEATGEALLLLRPSSAKPEMTIAAHGNWDQVVISLARP